MPHSRSESNQAVVMSTIPVQLPAELEQFVAAKVSGGHFASASDYIVALVDAARQNRSKIEAALLEGIQSGPPDEWTKKEWEEIRVRVSQRHQKD